MEQFSRFAIYYLPDGDLAEFGARWLGWDVDRGTAREMPEGAADFTARPRKYGFHGTLKPPMRLAPGSTPEAFLAAATALAGRLAPVSIAGLEVAKLGRFMALVPAEGDSGIGPLAAACVRDLDGFRAPAPPEELERRRAGGLTDVQEALLQQWGYPYVMEAFRFHMTLTGPVSQQDAAKAEALIAAHLPSLPRPFVLRQIALVGERADGAFQTIARLPLRGGEVS